MPSVSRYMTRLKTTGPRPSSTPTTRFIARPKDFTYPDDDHSEIARPTNSPSPGEGVSRTESSRGRTVDQVSEGTIRSSSSMTSLTTVPLWPARLRIDTSETSAGNSDSSMRKDSPAARSMH